MKQAIIITFTIVIFSLTTFAQQPAPQEEEEMSRRLWDTGFMQQRPKATTTAPTKPKVAYRRAVTKAVPKPMNVKGATPASSKTTNSTTPATGDESMLGMTIWRLRPSAAADDKETRILVQEEGAKRETSYTPERIEADTPITEGQRVRLSIESPSTGYLYVIDREQYADGSFGEPFLIFPTLRTRGGDNAVTAGRVIEIPAQEDNPSYFKLERSRNDHVAEIISIIVTPQPLDEIQIGRNALKLTAAQFAAWESKLKVETTRLEQVGTAGKAWTKAEKEAGADGKRKLTQEDPAPQTMYRLNAKPGEAVMVNVEMKISKGK